MKRINQAMVTQAFRTLGKLGFVQLAVRDRGKPRQSATFSTGARFDEWLAKTKQYPGVPQASVLVALMGKEINLNKTEERVLLVVISDVLKDIQAQSVEVIDFSGSKGVSIRLM